MIWPFNKFSPRAPRRTLDASAQSDPRNASYRVRELLASNAATDSRKWPCAVRLNQGKEGACVGFALTQWLATAPGPIVNGTNEAARQLYYDIKCTDQWRGEGTRIENGLALLKARAIISTYYWCQSAYEMRQTVIQLGPLVCKIPVFDGMYRPDFAGRIRPTGKINGWHAILLNEYDASWDRNWFVNSWGKRHGRRGRVWMTSADCQTLLNIGATAAYAVKPNRTALK